MKQISIKYGLIAGIIVSAIMATSMAILGCSGGEMNSASMYIGFGAIFLSFAFIYVAIKKYRAQNLGYVNFGQAFGLGLIITLIASSIYVLTWAVEYHFFFPDFMDKYAFQQIRELQNENLAPEVVAQKTKEILEQTYNYKHNPLVFAAFTYMEIVPVGLLVSLVSALILKKKPGPNTIE